MSDDRGIFSTNEIHLNRWQRTAGGQVTLEQSGSGADVRDASSQALLHGPTNIAMLRGLTEWCFAHASRAHAESVASVAS